MNYYSEIKEQLINNEITKKIKDYSKNKSDLDTYYNVGRLLYEEDKHYGNSIIKEYAKKLTKELGKGYTYTALTRMQKFYLIYPSILPFAHNLTWSHYCELIPLKDINKIIYYAKLIEEKKLSIRQLRLRIKNLEHKNLRNNNIKLNKINFTKKIILIKNSYNYPDKKISEKILQKLIVEDIVFFMRELGNGFSFIGNEYKVKIGNNNNFIDLLLFNIVYNCDVVIELKVTELKSDHIGQIEVYMNYIDKHLKTVKQNKTIGIIICKNNNKYIIEYCSDKRLISREYRLFN